MERERDQIRAAAVSRKPRRKERVAKRAVVLKAFLKAKSGEVGVTPLASAHFAVRARVGGSGGLMVLRDK